MYLKRICALTLLFALILTMPAAALPSRTKKVLSVAVHQIGAPYSLLSDAPHSFNCASFIAYCFNRVESGTITTHGIEGRHRRISSLSKVKPGDILRFRSGASGPISHHYGIYLGRGYLIHASSRAGRVTVSRLSRFRHAFDGGLRIY